MEKEFDVIKTLCEARKEFDEAGYGETEFNLSEKINKYSTTQLLQDYTQDEIRVKDVKEFIKILLETHEGIDENWIKKDTIRELAGDKLK